MAFWSRKPRVSKEPVTQDFEPLSFRCAVSLALRCAYRLQPYYNAPTRIGPSEQHRHEAMYQEMIRTAELFCAIDTMDRVRARYDAELIRDDYTTVFAESYHHHNDLFSIAANAAHTAASAWSAAATHDESIYWAVATSVHLYVKGCQMLGKESKGRDLLNGDYRILLQLSHDRDANSLGPPMVAAEIAPLGSIDAA